MAGTFETGGGNTTIVFKYINPTAKTVEILTEAAHYLWGHGYGDHGTEEAPVEFASLSNQEKLDIVDAHLRRVIMDAAKTYHANAAQDTARETALEYADSNLDL